MVSLNISEADRERYENVFVAKIPKDESVGNKSLMRLLEGWSEDLYYNIRNGLIDKGILRTTQGGGVRLVKELIATITEAEEKLEETEYQLERDLYAQIEKVLSYDWAKDKRYDDNFFFVEITANKRKGKLGKWSYPDLVFVGYRSYTYVPGYFLDVYSFEVKHFDGVNVDALYEALAHLRSVHRSYLIMYIPENRYKAISDKVEPIIEEAQRFGIGVIIATEISNFETWQFKADAIRREPDPEKLDTFIAANLNDQNKETVRKWAKK